MFMCVYMFICVLFNDILRIYEENKWSVSCIITYMYKKIHQNVDNVRNVHLLCARPENHGIQTSE